MSPKFIQQTVIKIQTGKGLWFILASQGCCLFSKLESILLRTFNLQLTKMHKHLSVSHHHSQLPIFNILYICGESTSSKLTVAHGSCHFNYVSLAFCVYSMTAQISTDPTSLKQQTAWRLKHLRTLEIYILHSIEGDPLCHILEIKGNAVPCIELHNNLFNLLEFFLKFFLICLILNVIKIVTWTPYWMVS
jgi:hypothetical protein